MRGSLKTQVTAALRCILTVGKSRHDAKVEYGRSPYIHAVGTFEKTAQRLWPLCSWLRENGTSDLELLTCDMAGKFLLDRLDYHRKQGNCRQSFKVEVAAIGSLESALTEFSRRNRKVPVTYDFSRVRLSFTKQAKQLPKYTSAYQGRALTNPEALIDALLLPEHKLMASLQLLCGCRTEGVGAPVRPVPGGNRLCLENFADAEGDIFPVRMDPASAAPVRQFWTKEKGGKIAVKYCPLSLADQVSAWLLTHPEGLGDDYANYLRAVNQAMHDTGQAVRGRGTRALRFNFAQRRLRQYFKAGFGDEEAKRRVSSEMSHNRPDITDGYYR